MYLGIGTKDIQMYNSYFFLVLDQVDYNKDKDLSKSPSSQVASKVSSYNYSYYSSAISTVSELSSMNLLVLSRLEVFS